MAQSKVLRKVNSKSSRGLSPCKNFTLGYLYKAETYGSVAIESGHSFLIPNEVSPE